MAPSGQPRRMRPRDIRFTQDSIGSRFTDGTYLSDTFEQLLNGRITVEDLEWIEVVEERSLYWALTGNRRLYLYRKLEDLGEIRTIPVREVSLYDHGVSRRFDKRNTTACDGLDVEMRQHQAERYINRCIEQWKSARFSNRNLNETSRNLMERHLPTESSNRATSGDRNGTNRAVSRSGIGNERVTSNDNEIVITAQPYNSTGFNSLVSELLRHGLNRSAQTGSSRSAERHSTATVEPGFSQVHAGSERSTRISSSRSGQPGSILCNPHGSGLPAETGSTHIHVVQPGSTRSTSRKSTLPTEPASVRSVQPGSTRSTSYGSIQPTEPVSTRSVGSRHRPKLSDLFYDGCGPNPVAPSSGSVRSSSSPRRPLPVHTNPDRSRTGVGSARRGTEHESWADVITYQPRGSTDPIMSPDETGRSCCSCWSCCCC